MTGLAGAYRIGMGELLYMGGKLVSQCGIYLLRQGALIHIVKSCNALMLINIVLCLFGAISLHLTRIPVRMPSLLNC